MVLVLVLGDLHIPHRAPKLPDKFKALLVPGKISCILCTGNIADKPTLDYLRTLASEVHCVRGDFDDAVSLPGVADSLPETKLVTVGDFKVGVVHGHQLVPWGDAESLGAMQRQLDADVLISGHTHRFATYEYEGKLFINPGSATGAFTPTLGLGETATPSFVLMDLQGAQAVIYVYELVGGEVKVKKIEHTRGAPAAVVAAPPPAPPPAAPPPADPPPADPPPADPPPADPPPADPPPADPPPADPPPAPVSTTEPPPTEPSPTEPPAPAEEPAPPAAAPLAAIPPPEASSAELAPPSTQADDDAPPAEGAPAVPESS
ncbi:vacuolar protein sorting protein 29 [Emiliania huxleyi CCMP1516]|uniref:Vacuolar protein sorting-associated protein 29 n=2 Tax=Emiliania huxleyi TaxID=2903 RepID=A0A0D3JDT7_EMIH1|nr:vacuolar protein sorting protein 29 [Emiliania huxleyi CCMP1516]EOD21672.1 vacuolar protein sorting protein 29 [Emiliania huxleyi CCMP1516]|eukprot:XP_005774101.1 vacuolar protein sorting protein 29 [Emiliania huxleyi CCMP1516]